jgi:hypothetical protein
MLRAGVVVVRRTTRVSASSSSMAKVVRQLLVSSQAHDRPSGDVQNEHQQAGLSLISGLDLRF